MAIKCFIERSSNGDYTGAEALAEAQHLAKLNHPNIAQIYHLSLDSEIPFMVLEFVDGCPVNDMGSSLSIEQGLAVFQQILEAVK